MKDWLAFLIVVLALAGSWLAWHSAVGGEREEPARRAPATASAPDGPAVGSREPVRREAVVAADALDTSAPGTHAAPGSTAPERSVVHGVVVDEFDGEPVPFLSFDLEGEWLVTGPSGAF